MPLRACGVMIIIFLSTPSARRATNHVSQMGSSAIFLSTPSARRATADDDAHGLIFEISIHALREEGDVRLADTSNTYEISIHALREEGDFLGLSEDDMQEIFLSTPSARRATAMPY